MLGPLAPPSLARTTADRRSLSHLPESASATSDISQPLTPSTLITQTPALPEAPTPLTTQLHVSNSRLPARASHTLRAARLHSTHWHSTPASAARLRPVASPPLCRTQPRSSPNFEPTASALSLSRASSCRSHHFTTAPQNRSADPGPTVVLPELSDQPNRPPRSGRLPRVARTGLEPAAVFFLGWLDRPTPT